MTGLDTLGIIVFPPSLWMFITAGLFALSGNNIILRSIIIVVSFLVTFSQMLIAMAYPVSVGIEISGLPLQFLDVQPYTFPCVAAFIVAAFLGGIYGLRAKTIELVAGFTVAGCAIGVTFAGDLISVFVYLEMMVLACAALLLVSGREDARAVTGRYVLMHIVGGAILLAGILQYINLYETSFIKEFQADTSLLFGFSSSDRHTVSMWGMLIGLLVTASAPPFSAWLPDAYPKTSSFGAVFLSVFTTNTALFLLLTLFPGTLLLLYIGVFMMAYAVIIGVWEQDIRRLLAYGILHQTGLMLVGIGVGTELTLQSVSLYMVCHVFYQLVLFMGAGAVLDSTGEEDCKVLSRYSPYHRPIFMVISIAMAVLTLLAVPFTMGFMSKPALLYGILQSSQLLGQVVILLVIMGTCLQLKFPWCVFFKPRPVLVGIAQHKAISRRQQPMQLATVATAALLVVLSFPVMVTPAWYQILPALESYNPYEPWHVIVVMVLILVPIGIFKITFPFFSRTEPLGIDFDWLYRVAVPLAYHKMTGFFRRRQCKVLFNVKD
jgi:multicomponent Na+:H+ antiporter subunit D